MFGDFIKNQLEQQLKQMAPSIKDNILKSFEALIDETAQMKDLPSFDLSVHVERNDKEVLALVYWDDILLRTIVLTEMIAKTFEQSFSTVPKFALSWVEKRMDGNSADAIVLDLLEDCTMLLKYNEEDELETYKVEGGQETYLDWGEFIANIKIEL